MAPFLSEESLGEGVTGLDVGHDARSRLSSSSIVLLFCGFGEFMFSPKEYSPPGCMQVLVGLMSFSLVMSDASDQALLPGLRLLPLPVLWVSRFVLLARD